MGFSLVLFANAALRVAQNSMTEALQELSTSGSTNSLLGRMATWEQRQAAVAKPFFDALELKYSTKDAS
jgi:2-methylisocitrate lyase-like PEP mutase family enzyme